MFTNADYIEGFKYSDTTKLGGGRPAANFLPSYLFFVEAQFASVLLLLSLLIAASTYLSLGISSARESQRVFDMWFKIFKYPLIIGYLLFCVGIVVVSLRRIQP